MEFATAEEKRRHRQARDDGRTATEQRNRYSLTDADVIELARYALDHREALRPSDGHRVGQGRRRRPALHPAGAPRDGEEPGRRQGRAALQAQGQSAPCSPRAARSARRSAPGPVRVVQRIAGHGPGAAGRRAGHRHDRPELGAGDEARQRDRHQPRRPHLPRGDHRARARHPGGGRLRRRDRGAEGRRARHGGLLGGRHRLRLRRPARDRGHRGAARRDAVHRRSRS